MVAGLLIYPYTGGGQEVYRKTVTICLPDLNLEPMIMDIQHQLIVLNGNIDGNPARLVNARQLHAFLGVRRDFSNWVKSRIEKYEFEAGRDFVVSYSPNLANQTGPGGNRRSFDYFLTLDMAKELAMVERTPQGRQARRYFIECERQWLQMRQRQQAANRPDLSRSERSAINRQAWADVSDQVAAVFHARRDELLRNYAQSKTAQPTCLPPDFRPSWVR